jgi:hypothetical protein
MTTQQVSIRNALFRNPGPRKKARFVGLSRRAIPGIQGATPSNLRSRSRQNRSEPRLFAPRASHVALPHALLRSTAASHKPTIRVVAMSLMQLSGPPQLYGGSGRMGRQGGTLQERLAQLTDTYRVNRAVCCALSEFVGTFLLMIFGLGGVCAAHLAGATMGVWQVSFSSRHRAQ